MPKTETPIVAQETYLEEGAGTAGPEPKRMMVTMRRGQTMVQLAEWSGGKAGLAAVGGWRPMASEETSRSTLSRRTVSRALGTTGRQQRSCMARSSRNAAGSPSRSARVGTAAPSRARCRNPA